AVARGWALDCPCELPPTHSLHSGSGRYAWVFEAGAGGDGSACPRPLRHGVAQIAAAAQRSALDGSALPAARGVALSATRTAAAHALDAFGPLGWACGSGRRTLARRPPADPP